MLLYRQRDRRCHRNCLFLRLARPHFRFDVRTDRFVRRAFLERHVLLHFEIVFSFAVTFARVKGSRVRSRETEICTVEDGDNG